MLTTVVKEIVRRLPPDLPPDASIPIIADWKTGGRGSVKKYYDERLQPAVGDRLGELHFSQRKEPELQAADRINWECLRWMRRQPTEFGLRLEELSEKSLVHFRGHDYDDLLECTRLQLDWVSSATQSPHKLT